MVFTAIVAAASTYVGVSAMNEQKRVQQQALAEQKKQNQIANQRAEAEVQKSEEAYNRANQQQVDVMNIQDAEKLKAKQGASGTLLTGNQGVNPEELNLGSNTLLGG
tara:strand:+ start:309 stop:629 length:321 start_codon:yes stop_codon:yes gene_type:complete